MAYLRDTDEEQIVVVAHRGPGMRPAKPLRVSHGAIPDGAELVEVLSGGPQPSLAVICRCPPCRRAWRSGEQ